MAQGDDEPIEDAIARMNLRQAALAGAVAFVLVFALLTGLVVLDMSLGGSESSSDGGTEASGNTTNETEESTEEPRPGIPTILSWFFFSSQFADPEVSGLDEPRTVDLIDDEIDHVPAIAFHLVPMLVLPIMGFAFARYSREQVESAVESAIFGSLISVGYLPLVALGIVLSWWETSIFTVMVPGFEGLVLVGAGYPVIFGLVGGLVASQYSGRVNAP